MATEALEQTIKHCRNCNRKTVHQRSYKKTGLVMFLVHVVLTIGTAGLWLLLVLIWKLLNKKVGGWVCSTCGS